MIFCHVNLNLKCLQVFSSSVQSISGLISICGQSVSDSIFVYIHFFVLVQQRCQVPSKCCLLVHNLCFYSFILKFFSYLYIWCCHTRGATFSARAVALSAIYGQSDQDLSAPGGDELVAKEKTRIKVPPAKCYFADII